MNNQMLVVNRAIAIVAIVLIIPNAAVRAQSAPPSTPPLNGDQAMVADIVMNAVSTITSCKLANEKSRNAELRSLCRQISADDARIAIAGMQLEEQLGATGVNLQPLPQTAQALDELAQDSGQEFDRAFLLAQIDSAETSRRAIRYALEVQTSAPVRRYENTVLQKLQRKIELAVSALRSVER